MSFAGQTFSEAILVKIRARIVSEATLTRSALSREVCEWLDWRTHEGHPKEVSCRIALQKLERRGLIELPPPRPTSFASTENAEAAAQSWPAISTTLQELGRVWLVPVNRTQPEPSRLWWAMMREHHPQGGGLLCGAQIRYLIACEIEGRTNFIGGLSFSAAAWRLAGRDAWIGWDDATRRAGLSKVVGNSRFLILPSVQVPNLASHVLSLAIARLPADWQTRYGITPALLETFVDRSRYRGTCYRASNWKHIGITQGRGRQDRYHTAAGSVKDILVYPLHPEWRTLLGAGSAAATPCTTTPSVLNTIPSDWAEQEFGGCALADKRLQARLLTMARDFYARPGANVAQACSSRAKTKAAYRFLDHDKTTMETLLQPHYRATETRARAETIVLAVQDTTSLNYTAHAATAGIGPIGSTEDGPQGLHLHSTLAVSAAGTPLGLLNVQCWARDPNEFGKKEKRHQLPIEEKESIKWLKSYRAAAALQARCPGTTVVSVGDREADLYELFQEATATANGPKLLVRAMHDRALKNEQQRLWQTMQSLPSAGMQVLSVPRQGNRIARDAHLAIRYAAVRLQAPSARQGPAIPVWVVFAQEQDAPAGVKPLEWMLLTTMPVTTLEQAIERLTWYARRWGIEVWHRTLKS
ncbi:MAG: IS4 family transposase, partial [Herbaspirillum sp.]